MSMNYNQHRTSTAYRFLNPVSILTSAAPPESFLSSHRNIGRTAVRQMVEQLLGIWYVSACCRYPVVNTARAMGEG